MSTDEGDASETTTAEPPSGGTSPGAGDLGVERYKVVGRIGKGGMGEVLAARDTVLGREIAIKRLLAANPTRRQVDRFLREARIQGTLDHPSIPPVYELAHDPEDRPYFAMKRLSGRTLAEVFAGLDARNPEILAAFARERLLRAFAEVCRAVEFAHVRGIIHRDLKPANIMLGDFGEVFVLDWGVAKVIGAADGEPTVHDALATVDDAMTAGGTVVGTRGYMAPEQATPTDVELDARADIYALGRVLEEILLCQYGRSELPDPPPELADLVTVATMREVADRLTSAWKLGDRVQRYLDGDRDLAQRRQLAEDHLSRALLSLDDHRLAMREAGRAMALDPTLPGAAELVGRLMLEPPRETPPEVEQSLVEARAKLGARQARIGVLGSSLYLVFLPFLLWIGIRNTHYLIAFIVLAGIQIVLAISNLKMPIGVTSPSYRRYFTIVGNAVLIGVVARMLTPFLIAPGIAAVTAAILASNPTFRLPSVVPVIAFLSLGVLIPWVAELSGVISPTAIFLPDMIQIVAVPGANVTAVIVGLTVFPVILIIGTGLLMLARVRVEDEIQRTIHMQTWQLRQLLPA